MTWNFTPELEQKIIDQLAEGISLRKICKQEDMPSIDTVFRHQDSHPEFAIKCARAREIQGHEAAERLDEINDKVESGKLDPAAARVISSNLQWKASKLASKLYGDSLKLKGDEENPIRIITDDKLDSRIADLLGKKGTAGAAGGKGAPEA